MGIIEKIKRWIKLKLMIYYLTFVPRNDENISDILRR
jgi:hypothetical protein